MKLSAEKKKYRVIIFISIFVVYTFLAAEVIPSETVFSFRWIASLDTSYPAAADSATLIPFESGGRFGYVDSNGVFSINQIKKETVYLSANLWAEYGGAPDKISIKNPSGGEAAVLENPGGYPFFLDGKIFVLSNEQHSISRRSETGEVVWSRDFAAPVTCADSAAGIFIAGLLDGTVEVINENGEWLYSTEPTGSRIAAVFGCAAAASGKAIAVICGIDAQRFLYIEQFGQNWRITHHEFLGEGLRRNVYVAFIDGGKRVLFEREDGVGIYDTEKRAAYNVHLNGRITGIDREGGGGMVLLITSDADAKERLIAIRYPDTIVIEAPFESSRTFLSRSGSTVFVGGGGALASFGIEKK
jgi:hypothetical protein